jgi:hypothetical protein
MFIPRCDFAWLRRRGAPLQERCPAYGPPGIPLIVGDGTGTSFVAALNSVRAEWTPAEQTCLTFSFVHGRTSTLVQQAGGKDFNYGAVVTSVRF